MRLSIVILTLCIAHGIQSEYCDKQFNIATYQNDVKTFQNKLYARIGGRHNHNFVFSPYSIWLSLAALAEGADRSVKNRILASLNLPKDICLRQKYYDVALNAETPREDVTLARRSTLFIDERLKTNPYWWKVVQPKGLLNVSHAPIKRNPRESSRLLRQFLDTRTKINVKGNSVLAEALDYQGLWTTAFDETSIEQQPFYNELGEQTGTVDMMRIKKQVRLAHLPFSSIKVLELPVGIEGQYSMLFALGIPNITAESVEIFTGSTTGIFSLLTMSLVPLDIGIPKFDLSWVFNARSALEEIGVRDFWRNPAATRYVSKPPAIPGGLIQRVSMKIDSQGVNPPPVVSTNILSRIGSGIATFIGSDFIANKPFLFALFDSKSHTCLLAGAYSKPDQP